MPSILPLSGLLLVAGIACLMVAPAWHIIKLWYLGRASVAVIGNNVGAGLLLLGLSKNLSDPAKVVPYAPAGLMLSGAALIIAASLGAAWRSHTGAPEAAASVTGKGLSG